jgi:hypothetical protein
MPNLIRSIEVDPLKDCAVCFLPCDPAIHAATVRVHDWLRSELKRKLEAVPVFVPKGKKFPPVVVRHNRNFRQHMDTQSLQ